MSSNFTNTLDTFELLSSKIQSVSTQSSQGYTFIQILDSTLFTIDDLSSSIVPSQTPLNVGFTDFYFNLMFDTKDYNNFINGPVGTVLTTKQASITFQNRPTLNTTSITFNFNSPVALYSQNFMGWMTSNKPLNDIFINHISSMSTSSTISLEGNLHNTGDNINTDVLMWLLDSNYNIFGIWGTNWNIIDRVNKVYNTTGFSIPITFGNFTSQLTEDYWEQYMGSAGNFNGTWSGSYMPIPSDIEAIPFSVPISVTITK